MTTIAKLNIPQGAFDGTKEITVITDIQTASIQFYPEMQFDKSLKLNVSYSGINLFTLYQLGLLKPGKLDFYYISDDGHKEIIENEGLTYKIKGGVLEVKNAKLKHFSRYQWAK